MESQIEKFQGQGVVESHDILVIGAGLSGINTAHVLKEQLPHRSVTILESRPTLGGTWGFFRYPGFRADASMSCFAFSWYPWQKDHSVATGPEILQYLTEAADAGGIREHIRFNHKVVDFGWHSDKQQWSVDVDAAGTPKTFKANFVVACTGYFSYTKALETTIPGIESFKGQVLHPQFWPEGVDWANKRVIVVGSGSTATTLVPELAKKAAHVTMLQRSPSHVITIPQRAPFALFLRRILPLSVSSFINRWMAAFYETFISQLFLAMPIRGHKILLEGMKAQLPSNVDVNVHFNPSYAPYRQRPSLVPDGDFFQAFHRGNCEVVTDVIDTVTSDGVQLRTGRKLDADIIITATGLYVELFNGITPAIDGKRIDIASTYLWRGCMLESLPNMGMIMGYTTQTWTLGADMMAKIVARVLKRMERTGATTVRPQIERSQSMAQKLPVEVTSNYFIQAANRMPKVTDQGPWYGRKHFGKDLLAVLFGSITDGLIYSGTKGSRV